jgi:hypothetical protein
MPTTFAHSVGGGALPAPPWLLSYIGVFGMLLTVVALRASWASARLARFAPAAAPTDDGSTSRAAEIDRPTGPTVGQVVGMVLLGLALAAALIGPDDPAANVAPVAVLVVWWVVLPVASLLVGDVMAAINPFVGIVSLLGRLGLRTADAPAPPSWIPVVFLGAWGWFFFAYHHPGSPRALAVFLLAYLAAALALGVRYGVEWLRTGEGFGALSAAVANLSPRGTTRRVDAVAALMVVWVGGTLFDGLTSTPFWVDVLGTSRGWARTGLNSVGLVWMTAVAAGALLLAFRATERLTAADRSDTASGADLVRGLGVALVPLALGWFVAHDLTLLLFEGQNFIALLSDPFGKGWDLFSTINRTIDYDIVQATWVRWVQVVALSLGHIAAVVIAHDVAIRLVGRRRGMAATWAMAVVAAASFVAAVLLVLQ